MLALLVVTLQCLDGRDLVLGTTETRDICAGVLNDGIILDPPCQRISSLAWQD